MRFLIFLVLFGEPRESLFVRFEVPDNQIVTSHFRTVYNYIRTEVEGNYVWHPHDKGGETYGGISRKLNPDWYGWRYVDQAKPLKRHQVVPAAEIWVLDYYISIWVREGFDEITDVNLAKSLFDFRIHSSPKTVRKLTNRVLVEMGYCPDDRINFNHLDPTEFILRLKIQRLILFNYLVEKDKTQYVFYRGWVKRIENI